MTTDKDSPEVVEFLCRFGEFKSKCSDDPTRVFLLASVDAGFLGLCKKVVSAAEVLRNSERQSRHLFVGPVNPGFISAWRDFETRYENILIANWSAQRLLPREGGVDSFDRSIHSTQSARRQETATLSADIQADLMEKVIEFLEAQDFGEDAIFDGEYSLSANQAVGIVIGSWERMSTDIGLDWASVYRRRELVPFVRIPTHVSQLHGEAEQLSLLTYLKQAQEAFILGLDFAAITLMRSILEITLKTHYQCDISRKGEKQGDLEFRIANACGLPRRCPRQRLDRIRHLGNDIVHFNKDKVRLPGNSETELLELLAVLRALIEDAPSPKAK